MTQNTTQIEAVLFDYGMVLSGPPNAAAWERILSITGFDEDGLHREYWKHRHPYDRGTHTGEAYWQLIAGGNGTTFDAAQIAGLIAADVDLWGDLNLPMVEWAQQLQRAGIRTGILSNIGDAMASGLLAKFAWLANFHHSTWSHTLKLAKPEPEIYLHAAECLATAPDKILFIDDRADNIEAARNFGMQAIQYADHAQFVEEMYARGFGSLLHPEPTAPQK
ncbi:HAD family hydrolase [Granulicella arctica]|uniref:Putative hydrolase of the HAD superfamily n=1 Tax=Granulicella arctica TaxID=940613 RepID=A0A7Y9PIA3_9BACT|nr:HAD family phosphatase [Granulicella arctica]NYF80264.1 putative hydrolase of the HAD superfamily [Granulicella arctica]